MSYVAIKSFFDIQEQENVLVGDSVNRDKERISHLESKANVIAKADSEEGKRAVETKKKRDAAIKAAEAEAAKKASKKG